MLRILLAEDHVLFRDALRSLLEANGLTVVCEASDGREALAAMESHRPDVAVLDIGMPGLNGLDTTRALLQKCPRLKIVVLTMHADGAYALEALHAGVKGYVLKSQSSSDLMDAIRTVMEGGSYLSPGLPSTVLEAILAGAEPGWEPLTPREREVLQLISEGRTTREIGEVLGISPKTAETHRTHVMQKLGVHETAGLVRYAIRRGLIQA